MSRGQRANALVLEAGLSPRSAAVFKRDAAVPWSDGEDG
jgi:hypothetical protein